MVPSFYYIPRCNNTPTKLKHTEISQIPTNRTPQLENIQKPFKKKKKEFVDVT